MKKPKSMAIVDDQDFPISRIRQSMITGIGMDIEEFKEKSIIAVVNSHTELNPGHMHLRFLAEKVKEGVHAAGGIPFEFNIPAPCDGFTEGNEGMRFILPQRELIADSVETHVRSMLFDGMVLIASCDKIIPGMIMAAARLNLPTIFLTGGPSAYQVRFSKTGADPNENRLRRNATTIATCGACDFMGTANTFQCMAESLGLALPGSANIPGAHNERLIVARQTGKKIVSMIEKELTAKKILTEKAMENAVIMDLAIGGSTNAALHLPAIAHELGLSLPLSKFNELNRKIPTLLAIRPNGPYGIIDLYAAGGIPAVMKVLADDLHLDALNVTGQTLGQIVSQAEIFDEEVIPPRDKPHLAEGGTAALFGNLAPEGAVIKQSAVAADMQTFTGQARVMDSEAEALKGFREGSFKEGEVIVIRYEGPKGGPGMPETLAVTLALVTSSLKRVALITDGRFSGATSGPCVGHVSPEAYVGGPIAALKDGDEIEIDIPDRKINVNLSENEIEKRLQGFEPVKHPVPPGFMRRYVKYVSSAAKGAILE
ncbi:MAG: dihydroxy-acid dehydratase [Deltaproteobacteria bacterium]|nr:dihydroxy-acid dehydratase [Deltaproteobacteria bacterium]